MEIINSADREQEKFLLDGLHEHARKFTDRETFETNDWGFYAYDNGKQVGGIHGRILKEQWVYVELFYIGLCLLPVVRPLSLPIPFQGYISVV
ncbi:MAG: hypothetical protein LBR55_03910 [Bacteroidales bacterium]|jgi:hypothetical protein|nr:hypothetical protein [Bacteroidales bacterium]